MNLGLNTLLFAIGVGIIVGLAFLIPTILWRLIRKKPLFPKGKKLESPKMLYFGIALLGGFTIISIFTGTPLFALASLIFMLLGIRALIVYKRNNSIKP